MVGGLGEREDWWERGGSDLSVYHEVTYRIHSKSKAPTQLKVFLERSKKTRLIVFFLKII